MTVCALRHLRQRRARLAPAGEGARDALLQLRGLEVAGDGEDQPVGADLLLVVALQIGVLDRREARFAAVDRAAVRMTAEQAAPRRRSASAPQDPIPWRRG